LLGRLRLVGLLGRLRLVGLLWRLWLVSLLGRLRLILRHCGLGFVDWSWLAGCCRLIGRLGGWRRLVQWGLVHLLQHGGLLVNVDGGVTCVDDVRRLLGLVVRGPGSWGLSGGRSIVSLLGRRLVARLGFVDRPGRGIAGLGWSIRGLLSGWGLIGWLGGGWRRLVSWLSGWRRLIHRLLGGRGLVDRGLGGGGIHRLGRGNGHWSGWGRGGDVYGVVAVALVLLLGWLGI